MKYKIICCLYMLVKFCHILGGENLIDWEILLGHQQIYHPFAIKMPGRVYPSVAGVDIYSCFILVTTFIFSINKSML